MFSWLFFRNHLKLHTILLNPFCVNPKIMDFIEKTLYKWLRTGYFICVLIKALWCQFEHGFCVLIK